jgi:poly(A) polymerase Pap1/uncharacterized protein (UPF0248 family)/endonuclease/exonuclease/phosphatase family metal-dependent hydrolase
MAHALSESAQGPGPGRKPIQVNRYDTALAIIPPRHLWPSIERLRSLYDQHHHQWPPHINLIYPFVGQETLAKACEAISPAIRRWKGAFAAQEAEQIKPHSYDVEEGERSNNEGDAAVLSLLLDAVDVFEHRENNTIFLHAASADQNTRLAELRASILRSLGHGAGRAYRMHMSIAQTEDAKSDAHKFLAHKIGFLPAVEWQVSKLHILVRERVPGTRLGSVMSLWGSVDLGSGELTRLESPTRFYNDCASSERTKVQTTERNKGGIRPAFKFDTITRQWTPDAKPAEDSRQMSTPPEQLAISSYNVLGEFSWPPSQARYPALIDRILDESSKADVLVLQEVQDEFLSYLLADEEIRSSYPYTSHAPPSQLDLDPLPSFLNSVILSRLKFDWEWVPFHRKHKGSIVATFGQPGIVPLVLATVHLTHGLTDGAVSAKKIEVQTVVEYLTAAHAESPWLLAGDFNIPTSSYTLDRAQKANAISTHTRGLIDQIERHLAEVGLLDAYSVARLEGRIAESDDVASDGFEGERGATYDPIVNKLAEAVVGNSFAMRPQRLDRIYVRGLERLSIAAFNRFGFSCDVDQIGSLGEEGATFASDHWGVRCLLKAKAKEPATLGLPVSDMPQVEFVPASVSMSDSSGLTQFLAEVGAIPSKAEAERREKAFKALNSLVEDATSIPSPATAIRQQVVAVLVGSSGLGTFTSTSDMDILCIGPFSARTFFTLIVQRLRRLNASASASSSDGTITLLRRVNANSGTMLELSVDGIKTDLQYAPAPVVAERWPQILRAPATDPVWALSARTLSKLKAARDMDFLVRSTPDLAVFRLAHRTIKTWAHAQGVYASKFGLLNGMAISVMLSRVHKLLVLRHGSVTAPDLLRSFYRHYAEFDWDKNVVFDPFFHKLQQQQQGRAPHVRTATEPFVVLGHYPPALNITHAASKASARTMAHAFKSAEVALWTSNMSWHAFLSGNGADDFLVAFKTYIRIDVQYWGISAAKSAVFVGWFESRLVQVLVDVGRRAPDLHARIWPARFLHDNSDVAATAVNTDNDSLRWESQEQETDSGFCYLIGLEKRDEALSKEALRLTIGSLQTVLRRFEERIRAHEQHFDAKSCWMTAGITPQKNLGRLRVDERDMGDFMLGEDDDDDDDDDDELEEEDAQLTLDSGDDSTSYLHNPRHRSKKDGGRSRSNSTAVTTHSHAGKLRPASDVLHRLRWDSSMDSGEYIVGYEDRFLGIRERALDSWKLEQTDEEFIPQHRIVYFRRKAHGSETVADAIVWDRRTRKDAIFGSG